MVDLTVVILTKNEEANLRKCVESFRGIAKRFVVIDSYSTDGTERLCDGLNLELEIKNCSLDFIQHEFTNHAEQFNWGISNSNITTEWIMRMDADEELMENLSEEINAKLANISDSVNGVVLKRRVLFMGKWIKHGGRYPEMLLRIIRTGTGKCEQKSMDEHLIIDSGDIVNFEYDLIDNNQKSLEWWIGKHNWYSNREVFDYQHRLAIQREVDLVQNSKTSNQAKIKRVVKNGGYYRLPLFLRAHLYFIYRYYIKLGFLDGKEGKIFHFLQAYWYRFLVDAKIYECELKGIEMSEQGALK